MATIKTRQIANEIASLLTAYTKDVVRVVNRVGNAVTNEAVENLRQASSQTFAKKKTRRERTGRYAEGWTVKRITFSNAPTRYIIHNKDRYQLAHLLEKGHANRDGTRTAGTPHIKPVEEKLIEAYFSGVEEAIFKLEQKKIKLARKGGK